MSIQAAVTRSASKCFRLTVWYVPVFLRETLGKSEVHYEDLILAVLAANEEVVWLYIPVYDPFRVDKLNSFQHL